MAKISGVYQLQEESFYLVLKGLSKFTSGIYI
jgi:hypothetical protein